MGRYIGLPLRIQEREGRAADTAPGPFLFFSLNPPLAGLGSSTLNLLLTGLGSSTLNPPLASWGLRPLWLPEVWGFGFAGFGGM